ncbi:MAG: hypothetical protein EPN93_07945 [Spirochaetes bacterium]|nr:MAG: hypothetical protein EPN93_07945 [Spirochaetota bacterium]
MILKKSNILSNKFVLLIEDNIQEIAEQFMNDLLKSPETIAYRQLGRQDVYEAAYRRLHEISQWISKNYPKQEIERYYRQIGRERYEQGIPFSAAFRFLVLLKRHMWLFVLNKLYYDATIYEQALDLNNRVVLYFDRAAYYLLCGYEDMLNKKW